MAFWDRAARPAWPRVKWNIPRNSWPIIFLTAVVLVYAWTVIRDLRTMSDSLAPQSISPDSNPAPSVAPPEVLFDELAMMSSNWFGAPPAQAKEVHVETNRPPQVEPAQPSPEAGASQPVEIVVQPFPSMKLSGIVLGDRVRQVVAEVDGQKQRLSAGEDLNGWRLVEMDRMSATFESPAGNRETVRMFPNSPQTATGQ